MGEVYRSAYTLDHFTKEDVTVKAGQWVRIGEYRVQAGELVSVGFGGSNGQESAQGRIFMDIKDAAGQLEGFVRLSVYSPQDRPIEIIHEFNIATLRLNETDRTKQVPFPEDQRWLSQDKKLVLEFKAAADGTIDKSKTKLLMDMTLGVV